jgi:hypothetical protein
MARFLIVAPGLSKDDPTNTVVNGTLEFAMRLADSEDAEFGAGHEVVEVTP